MREFQIRLDRLHRFKLNSNIQHHYEVCFNWSSFYHYGINSITMCHKTVTIFKRPMIFYKNIVFFIKLMFRTFSQNLVRMYTLKIPKWIWVKYVQKQGHLVKSKKNKYIFNLEQNAWYHSISLILYSILMKSNCWRHWSLSLLHIFRRNSFFKIRLKLFKEQVWHKHNHFLRNPLPRLFKLVALSINMTVQGRGYFCYRYI